VPISKQRLIFRGRLLKDADKIEIYKISNLDVIHLVAKPGNVNTEERAQNANPPRTQEINLNANPSFQVNPNNLNTQSENRSFLNAPIAELIFDRSRLFPSIFDVPRRLRRVERRNSARQDPSKYELINKR